jgi:hypothetical protein
MKKIFLFVVLMIAAAKSFACSMEVDENYTKNLLVAHAASFHSLFLPSTSGVTVTDYSLSFEGGAGGGSCPDYMVTSARVHLEHVKSATSICSYDVTVVHTVYIGNDIPSGPVENVEFLDATAACSTSSGGFRRIPRRIPIPFKVPRLIIKPHR